MSLTNLKTIVEALLFVSDCPMSPEDLLGAFETNEVNLDELKDALSELTSEYSSEDRAFNLKEIAGGYQFRTRPEFSIYALRLRKKSPSRLSRAAMETLAVIAYRQPILRAEIEKLRGVDAGGVIKSLMEKDLIRIASRQENLPGRPILYATTAKFLETFDLPSLAALPTLDEINNLSPPEAGSLNKLF
ncbi:MAG: SMC-Scp complex subunit ScpB [Deltaproteobacteria bacterium]|jgi:segregation and condensation protein B|nr:SMC-Scp complex subunit ScpB [Deltaproteobacteria bacterium]